MRFERWEAFKNSVVHVSVTQTGTSLSETCVAYEILHEFNKTDYK